MREVRWMSGHTRFVHAFLTEVKVITISVKATENSSYIERQASNAVWIKRCCYEHRERLSRDSKRRLLNLTYILHTFPLGRSTIPAYPGFSFQKYKQGRDKIWCNMHYYDRASIIRFETIWLHLQWCSLSSQALYKADYDEQFQ